MYTTDVVDDRGFPRSKLPLEERWSARFFEPKDVFTEDKQEEKHLHEVEQFYDLNTWASYRKYLASDLCESTQRPTRDLFSYREFNRIAKDVD